MKRWATNRSEEHTSELQSPCNLVCRVLLRMKRYTATTNACASRQATASRQLWAADRSAGIRQEGVPGAILQVSPPLEVGHVFFNDTATTKIYTLSLHDALPI